MRAQYNSETIRSFDAPRPDVTGRCNDFAETKFMQNSENAGCSRIGALSTLCGAGSVLDANSFVTGLVLLAGQSVSSATVSITSPTYYTYSGGSYASGSAATISFANNVCSNYAREVHYKITVVEQANDGSYGFGITEVTADVVLDSFTSAGGATDSVP